MRGEFDLAEAMGLAAARKLMRGRGGRPPAVQTVRRWANPARGCYPAGKGGPRVVLQTRKVSGEVLTTAAWVEAFERERAVLGAREAPRELPRARSDRRRIRDLRLADEGLDAAGVGTPASPC